MKKIAFSIILIFFGISHLLAQESYYYCQGKKVFLSENVLIRYVGLKNTLAEDQVKNIQERLNNCCSKVYEYPPYFAKYFILEDKIEQFNEVIYSNDSLIILNTPDYSSADTLLLFPSRTILVKIKPITLLLPILDSIGVPYNLFRANTIVKSIGFHFLRMWHYNLRHYCMTTLNQISMNQIS